MAVGKLQLSLPRRLATRAWRVKSTSRSASTVTRKQNRLPASYYRGGTSRAIIFHRKDLPTDRKLWAPIFRNTIGSADPNGRELDGLGGGVSSLSKVCVVGSSEITGADVDYTFAALGVRDESVDYSSNCGNMTSAIGPWAVDHGLVEGQDGQMTVRIRNTNTGKIIHSTFPIVDGEAAASGEFEIDGVNGKGARVELAFVHPAGSKTGKLLPTGNAVDQFELGDGTKFNVTCIDVGNPCVFVSAEALDVEETPLPDEIEGQTKLMTMLESIRRCAAVRMGLCKKEEETPGSIPKIAMVSKSRSCKLLNGQILQGETIDIIARALSMGQVHRAVPITVAMALAAAADIESSVVNEMSVRKGNRKSKDEYIIGHPSGKLVVGCEWSSSGTLIACKVYRTARRLMEGLVYWKPSNDDN